ncbi:MAG: prepilin peptidase [Candidatus Omnitrophota bacterium]
MLTTLLKTFIFILGLVVGSFLNVCIYRMSREISIRKPNRSFCPHCKKTIPWYDNIPVVSFILLKARCRFCSGKISWQYPVVELITGIMFVILYNYFGLSWALLVYGIFIAGLIISTFTDIEERIIPDEISLGGIVVGLILSVIFPFMHKAPTMMVSGYRSILGIIIGGGILYLFAIIGDILFFKIGDFISQKLFKKEIYLKKQFKEGEEPSTMGGGDIKLLAMIGAFLGWQQALVTLFLSCILAAITGIIIKIKTKGSLIAFGPFIVVAAIISLFFGEELIYFFTRAFYF